MHIARWLFILVLGFAGTAAAQAIRVTSQLSGDLLFQGPQVLQQIGHGDFYGFTGNSMPFDLTLSAIIDPEAVSELGNDSQVYAYDADVAVTLAMGGTTSRFSSTDATVQLSSDPAGYRMQVTFGIDLVIASFTTWLRAPLGVSTGWRWRRKASCRDRA